MQTEAAAYQRIVLKLSGEALQEPGARGKYFAADRPRDRASELKKCTISACRSRVVIGGGNIWRGLPRHIAEWTARPRITWECSRR